MLKTKIKVDKKVTGRNPECKRCPLNKTSDANGKHYVCLWSTGSDESGIIFIGEAPGKTELIEEENFVGMAGEFFHDYLNRAGITKFRVGNTVKCRPPDNRAPKNSEIKMCASYLDYEIEQAKPKVIGVLGSTALKRLIGTDNITKLRGKPFWSEKYSTWCIPMWHPAFIVRNGKKAILTEAFLKDLKLVKQIAETGDTGQVGTEINVVDTWDKFTEFRSLLADEKTFSFDTETVGTFIKGDVLMMQFSWKVGQAFILPFYRTFADKPCTDCKETGKIKVGRKKETCDICHGRGGFEVEKQPIWNNTEKDEIWQYMKAVLEDENFKKIGQNIKYDYQFLRQFDIAIRGIIFDTMFAHYLLDENDLGGHGLRPMALVLTDMGDYSLELYQTVNIEEKDVGCDTYATVPFNVLCKYAGKDTDATFRLFCLFYKKIKDQNLLPLMQKIMLPLAFELAEMERTGVLIDKDHYIVLAKEYEDLLKKLELTLLEFPAVKSLEKMQGKPVNFNSHDQVRALLYDVLQLPVQKMTKKNKKSKTVTKPKPSTDHETLERLQDLHDIPKLMLEWRELSKFWSTYIKPMPDYIGIDGRVHTSYTQTVTVTGRNSSYNPNMQNIPKKNPVRAKQIRDGIKATPGFTFGEWDFGQIEFRKWANYSQDPVMIADISNKDMDIHKKIASLGFAIPYEEVTQDVRGQAKTIVYAVMFGKSKENLAKETGLTVDQVAAVFAALFGRYKVGKQWIDDTINRAKGGHDIIGWTGRRRRLQRSYKKAYAIKDNRRLRESLIAEANRQAVNSPIQGGASDILSVATIRVGRMLRKHGFKSRAVLTIHDALVVEIHNSEMDLVPRLVKEEMERPINKITVPMTVDAAFGACLGEMEKTK